MAVPTVTGDFLAVVRKSGLIDERKILEIFPTPDDMPQDPQKVAAVLLRAGLLTQFQAKQLLAGKFRGFMLGTYKLLEPVGKGGMGTVFLAEHTSLHRKVAIKVLPNDKARDKLTLERFNREARAAAALDHSNIVRLHDISQGSGVHFIVMEYIEGNDLQSLMAKTGPLHFAQAAHYIAMAASGLQHAHEKGFVHRDIKPGNLMLTKDGTIKILDMGLARSFTDEKDNLTAQLGDASDVAGTADYISPEQAMQKPVDERSDIYSLGATLFALVTGHPPFRGSTVQKLMQHQMAEPPRLSKLKGVVPPALSEVVAKMLAKKPADRYQCAADVIDALSPWLPAPSTGNIAQDPITNSDMTPMSDSFARRVAGGTTTRARMNALHQPAPNNKKKFIAVGAGVVLLLIVGVVGGVLMSGSSKPSGVVQNGPTVPPANTNPNPVATQPNNTAPPDHDTTPVTPPPQPKPNVQTAKFIPRTSPNQQPSAGPTTPKGPAAQPGVIYASNFNALIPVDSIADNKTNNPLGQLPNGWRCEVYKANVQGIFRIAEENGQRILGVCDNKGEAGAQLKFEPFIVNENMIQPNRQYMLRIEYKSDASNGGFIRIQQNPTWKMITQKLVPPAADWQIAQVPIQFTTPTKFQIVMGTGQVAEGKFFMVRKLEIVEVGSISNGNNGGGSNNAAVSTKVETPVTNQFTKSVQQFQFTTTKPFKAVFQDGMAKDGEWFSGLPEGVSAYCWKKESVAELRAENTDRGMAIGMTNLNNDLSAQITFKMEEHQALVPNRDYLVRVEYRTSNDAKGLMWVRKPDFNSLKSLELTNTDGQWKTAEVTFRRPTDTPLHLLLTNEVAGEGNILWVRKVEVLEPATK